MFSFYLHCSRQQSVYAFLKQSANKGAWTVAFLVWHFIEHTRCATHPSIIYVQHLNREISQVLGSTNITAHHSMSQLQNLHFEIEAFKVAPETIVASAVDDEGGGGRRKMRHASKEGGGTLAPH